MMLVADVTLDGIQTFGLQAPTSYWKVFQPRVNNTRVCTALWIWAAKTQVFGALQRREISELPGAQKFRDDYEHSKTTPHP